MPVRVTSQKTRQMLLVTGAPLNPLELPERVQLFNEDGQIVDVTQDPSKMRWAGEWDVDSAYIWNDVVMDTGKLFILTNPGGLPAGDPRPIESDSEDWFLLTVAAPPSFQGVWNPLTDYSLGSIVRYSDALWISPGGVPVGREPGWTPDDPVAGTFKGQDYFESERFNATDPELIVIAPPPAGRRHEFVPGTSGLNPGAILFLDKTDVTSGLVLTIAGMSREGVPVDTDLVVTSSYASSWTYIPGASGNIHYTAVDAHTPTNFNIPDNAESVVVVVSFADDDQNGSFTAQVNSAENLVAPPASAGPEWELMLQGVA